LALVGKPQSRRSKTGVYIFTHKVTNSKYVGSINDLSRRFKQYFEKNVLFNNKATGLLLPLIEKDGFESFILEIIIIPSSYPKYSHCFL
jgi:group I intron endonuclease